MMNPSLYALVGCALFVLGLYGLAMQPHLLRKIIALNIASAGIFLVMITIAYRGPLLPPDPVPHAMVLTGIVVAVCGTALGLILAGRISRPEEKAGPGATPPGPKDGA